MAEINKLSKIFQGYNFEYTRAKFHIENTKSYLKQLLHDRKQASTPESLKSDLDTGEEEPLLVLNFIVICMSRIYKC